jgi:hypothetical protein
MGLLDRFRAQPGWKNASPAVRAAAVEELPLDQQDTLISIAREDRDAGVRIAALRKVIAPEVIAAIGRADADARVKEEAVTLLVDLASGAFEATEQSESLAALDGLTDSKHVVAVARAATNETVARAAVDRLRDDAAWAAVARQATLASIRLDALGRVNAPAELANIALRTEFKDVGVAAVERLSARDLLVQVADRARNKTAAKRARALVRAMDAGADAIAATAAQAVDPAVEAGRERVRAARVLCERLEALASGGLDEGEAVIAEIERSWRALEPVDDDLIARFETARAGAELALAQHRAEDAERTRLRHADGEAAASRKAICEQIDAMAGDELPGRIAEARAAWAALPPLSQPSETDRWNQRFEGSCSAALRRHHGVVRQRELREKASGICAEAERLALVTSAQRNRSEVQALRQAWQQLAAAGLEDAAVAERFAAADARLRELEAAAREERARQLQQNRTRLQALCGELEGVAKADDLSLKQVERALREARAAIDEAVPLPDRQDRAAIDERLRAVLAMLAPKVHELRDLDEWQRWANASVQEDLCRRVEQLTEATDLAAAAKQLRELQAHWKQVATAPRDQAQPLWARFKAASDAVRARCDVYFAGLAEEQAANRARKETLCAQAETLSLSGDWIRTADAIKALQAEWKTVGAATRAEEKLLWERFHAACDGFFTRRREDLQRRKGEWAANLARKEAICVQAEAIARTIEWQKGIEDIKRLQAEWKTIGPVRKTRADEVWQRFRAACDQFFEAYQQRDQVAAAAVVGEAEAVVAELEALLPAPGAEAPAPPVGLGDAVADIRRRWAEKSAALPRERALRTGDRFAHALARLTETWPGSFSGTDIDPEANTRKLEDLCAQVERLLGSDLESGAPAEAAEDRSPASVLARQLREALATNTIAGRVDESAKWKLIAEQVRSAQAAWKKVGPVPEAVSRTLNARFQRACTRVAEKMDRGRRGL